MLFGVMGLEYLNFSPANHCVNIGTQTSTFSFLILFRLTIISVDLHGGKDMDSINTDRK